MLNPQVELDGPPHAPGRLRPGGFRPDVQALRALAVSLVVLNHLWPARLTGGYVGVDVFFVISGYLISTHLLREIENTGRIRIARFYARRVRRLLPAAFLVLICVVVAAFLVVPHDRWAAYGHQVMAGALYGENWLLTAEFWSRPVDFTEFTAVTSYWSLSVEEQFYLCWPVVLLLLFRMRTPRMRCTSVAAVGLASLAGCVYLTTVDRGPAYFVTPIRVWEFVIGTLVALGGQRLVLSRAAAQAASLLGFAAIIGSAVLFTGATEFPGATALIPTVGAGLVIAAGAEPGRRWHTAVTSSAPVQLLGGISYSLYLWHWPLVVLVPLAVPGGALTLSMRLGILGVSLVLAHLSTRLVEDPVRTWPRLARDVRLTFAGMVAGMAVVCLAAGGLLWA
ncbi:acyltransferase family protein [Kitasatospora sp. NPDC056651]|uniref:acyltransferase family protein n=1 Tax=Kitasatospora sp. NPDC056651 TaxID=3345892 RepID=UPI0036948D99